MRRRTGPPILAALLVLGAAGSAQAERDPGLTPADACPDSGLVSGLAAQDAQGSTFVGTYLGETTRDGVMTVFWRVEQVYAGGPLNEMVWFRTPRCRWVNLTPGERYLFSTAAEDLDLSDGVGDEPAVTDSLAWRLLANGSVELAPFDTYSVSDYASAVSTITSFDDALQAVAPGTGPGEEPGPIDVDFGCAEEAKRVGLDDVRGVTFIGSYVGDARLPSWDVNNRRIVWSLERVYAGGPLPEVLTFRSDACLPATLKPGRYLFSTSNIVAPGQSNSVAWRLRDRGGVRLVGFGGLGRKPYRADVKAIEGLEAAIEALAPGAGPGEPPLRATDRTPG